MFLLMKVMYILHATVMGGATIALMSLVEELAKYGVEPIWILPKSEKKSLNEEFVQYISSRGWQYELSHINPLGFPAVENNVLKKIYRGVRWAKRHFYSIVDLNRLIDKYQPDIVHTNTGIVQEAYFVCKKKSIPHVWHIREYQDKDFSTKLFPNREKVCSYFNDSFSICITNGIKDYFTINNRRSKVIYDPLFSKRELNENTGTRDVFFLIANRISPEKGMDDIITAFSIFHKDVKECKLLVAGEGKKEYVEKLKRICVENGIADSVSFLGYVAEIKPLMEKAKCLIVGSFYEGFGMMTAEANMVGCPVIGRNTAGTREILDFTGGGILCDSIEDFLKAMKKIWLKNSDELTIDMKQASCLAQNNYNKEISGRKVFDFYSEIINIDIPHRSRRKNEDKNKQENDYKSFI